MDVGYWLYDVMTKIQPISDVKLTSGACWVPASEQCCGQGLGNPLPLTKFCTFWDSLVEFDVEYQVVTKNSPGSCCDALRVTEADYSAPKLGILLVR